jgi:hypothetical protein
VKQGISNSITRVHFIFRNKPKRGTGFKTSCNKGFNNMVPTTRNVETILRFQRNPIANLHMAVRLCDHPLLQLWKSIQYTLNYWFLRNSAWTACRRSSHHLVTCNSLSRTIPNANLWNRTTLVSQVEVFWVVTPWRRRQHGPPKRWHPTTTLHGVTTQKTSTWKTSPPWKSQNSQHLCHSMRGLELCAVTDFRRITKFYRGNLL